MHVGIIGHWEAWLHGTEVVPYLDLCHGQSHRCAATNAMEGNLLGARQDVVQIVNEQRAPGVDGTVAAFTASWRFSNYTIGLAIKEARRLSRKGQ